MSTGPRKIFDAYTSGGLDYIKSLKGEGIETYLQDFKELDERGDFTSKKNRQTYAAALSGFANSEGGCIIWGVRCKREKPDSPDAVVSFPRIKNLTKFVSDLNILEASLVSPGVIGVEHFPVREIENGKEIDEGYVVSYIPKMDGFPYMAMGADQHQFFYRAGSSFSLMYQNMVASRFAKQPQPRLALDWYRNTDNFIHVVIKNTGLINAREVSFVIDESISNIQKLSFQAGRDNGFQVQPRDGRVRGILESGKILHTMDYLELWHFSSTEEKDYSFRYKLSCHGALTMNKLVITGREFAKGKRESSIISLEP